jgi:PhnB protein
MPILEPYLSFDGTCADAMRFYERVLGGKIEMMMTNADSPMAAQTAPASANRIMHARLAIGDRAILASDLPAGTPSEGFGGFSLSLTYPTAAEAQPVFDALAEGGKVTMPMQKTFWAEGFGMLHDKFGVRWMLNAGMQAP